MIRQRIKGNKAFIVVEQVSLSPLLHIWPTIVSIIIQLSHIIESISPSLGHTSNK